jgi:hypothetical protein
MNASPFAYPIPGDVLYVPCLGARPVQVTRVTTWRITLELYADPARPIVASWWRPWFRWRCRRARFIHNLPLPRGWTN